MASGIAHETLDPEVRDLVSRPVLETAPGLLGWRIRRRTPEKTMEVRIVETEAYREDDPASHSFHGETERTAPMFGPGGFWYVYLCYGIHWMINIGCGKEGTGQAVLIRAGEPLTGESMMEGNRGQAGIQLTNGPGKLAEALSVDDKFSGEPVGEDSLELLPPGDVPNETIYESPRVGIQQGTEKRWRFYLDNPYRSDVEQNEHRRRRN